LIENLGTYAANIDLKNLVTYPPKLEPIPVKPLFFDVAYNYIEYPGREVGARTESGVGREMDGEQGQERTAEQKRKGWFSFGR